MKKLIVKFIIFIVFNNYTYGQESIFKNKEIELNSYCDEMNKRSYSSIYLYDDSVVYWDCIFNTYTSIFNCNFNNIQDHITNEDTIYSRMIEVYKNLGIYNKAISKNYILNNKNLFPIFRKTLLPRFKTYIKDSVIYYSTIDLDTNKIFLELPLNKVVSQYNTDKLYRFLFIYNETLNSLNYIGDTTIIKENKILDSYKFQSILYYKYSDTLLDKNQFVFDLKIFTLCLEKISLLPVFSSIVFLSKNTDNSYSETIHGEYIIENATEFERISIK